MSKLRMGGMGMGKDVSLRAKLIGGFAVIVLFVTITGGVGYWGASALTSALTLITDRSAPQVDVAMEMVGNLRSTALNLARMKSATAVIPTDNATKVASLVAHYNELVATYDESADLLLKGGRLPGADHRAFSFGRSAGQTRRGRQRP